VSEPVEYGNPIVGDWACLKQDGGCGHSMFPRLAREAQVPYYSDCEHKKLWHERFLKCPKCGKPMIYDEYA
jgi:hypothetical protein